MVKPRVPEVTDELPTSMSPNSTSESSILGNGCCFRDCGLDWGCLRGDLRGWEGGGGLSGMGRLFASASCAVLSTESRKLWEYSISKPYSESV